jgi:hypothetical protein
MLSSAFAFAELSSKVTNNTSVVLLIEWRNRRLLLVGDAEWDARFRDGKANAAWNVMWHERRELLGGGVDFLKIGHHGSENATPWGNQQDGESEPATILDAILPRQRRLTTQAIVSTERRRYKSIPHAELLVELGTRVCNVRTYQEEFEQAGIDPRKLPYYDGYEKLWLNKPQPLRTDFEFLLGRKLFVEAFIQA